MCGHIDPHFQTSCHWMTPFLFFTFCSHLMTPIFKMLSHLMTPFWEIDGLEWSKNSTLSKNFSAIQHLWILPNFILCRYGVVKNLNFEPNFQHHLQWRSHWGSRWNRVRPYRQKLGKRGKNSGKRGNKKKKRKNREGSFTLPLLTDRASYANWLTVLDFVKFHPLPL